MRVIRVAEPRKLIVIGPHIPVDPFPVPVRVYEGIIYVNRLEKCRYPVEG
ncbi:MAG: hypothetical protein V3V92_02965 [Candidatus Hydrothermarchaeales archaeon]